MSTKKRSSPLRIPPDQSGSLPDELLRRNLELNVDFVVFTDFDPFDQRGDDHMLGFHAGLVVPFNPGQHFLHLRLSGFVFFRFSFLLGLHIQPKAVSPVNFRDSFASDTVLGGRKTKIQCSSIILLITACSSI